MNLKQLKDLPRKTWLIIIASVTVVLAGVVIFFLAGSLHRLGNDPDVPSLLRREGDSGSLYAQIAAKEQEIGRASCRERV